MIGDMFNRFYLYFTFLSIYIFIGDIEKNITLDRKEEKVISPKLMVNDNHNSSMLLLLMLPTIIPSPDNNLGEYIVGNKNEQTIEEGILSPLLLLLSPSFNSGVVNSPLPMLFTLITLLLFLMSISCVFFMNNTSKCSSHNINNNSHFLKTLWEDKNSLWRKKASVIFFFLIITFAFVYLKIYLPKPIVPIKNGIVEVALVLII